MPGTGVSPELQPAKGTERSDKDQTVSEWDLNTGHVEGAKPSATEHWGRTSREGSELGLAG